MLKDGCTRVVSSFDVKQGFKTSKKNNGADKNKKCVFTRECRLCLLEC